MQVHPNLCAPGLGITRGLDENRRLMVPISWPLAGRFVSDRTRKTAQPAIQGRVSFGCPVVPDRGCKSLLLTDQHDELLASGQPGVEEVPLQEHVMLHGDREHHGREFGALALVYSDGIGGENLVEFIEIVGHLAPSKAMMASRSASSNFTIRPMSPLKTSLS